MKDENKNIKEYKIKGKIISKYFLILFILLNLVCLAGAIFPAIGQPYSKEKMMMRTAVIINHLYIFPLSKVFGNHNVLTVPFYAVRDKLYYTAYNMYPKNEAEKEIQWYAVMRSEYKTLYHPMYLKYFKINPEKLANNDILWRWTDEFYNNAMLLSKESTKQPYFNQFIFSNFVGEIFNYLEDRPLLFLAKDNRNYTNFLSSEIEIDRLNNILITFQRLENDFRKNNLVSLNYFLKDNNVYCQEFLIKHNLLVYLLTSRQYNQTFNCVDPLITQYVDNKKEMINYLENPPKETLKTMNKETIYGDLYKWQLNKNLEKTLVTQCKVRME